MNKNKGNMKKEYEAIMKILRVFSDGKEHKIKDFEENRISSKTFYTKFLKLFGKLVEKRKDESGKYPYAVYYKATPELMIIWLQIQFSESGWEDVKEQFMKTKDLSQAITNINTLTNTDLMKAFMIIKNEDFDTTNQDTLETFFEFFVWSTYEYLTLNLVRLCTESKILNGINLEEVIKKLTETRNYG